MSTDRGATRRARSSSRRRRAFAVSFGLVIAALVVVGVGGAAIGITQGPRVTGVQMDPAAAAAASGGRLIVTTSQSLADIDTSQVTVTPDVPFTVDTSGRSLGVRFGLPLWDDTEYTVKITDVQGYGGGPSSVISETFHTPAAEMFLLKRGADEDTIFRTGLTGDAVPVYSHEHIEDYRATSAHLVVSTRDDDDKPALVVTDLDGQNARSLKLPGDGTVASLQSADRGELIGYTFSSADLSESGGEESRLYTTSLQDSAADQDSVAIDVQGADPRIAQWRFVPDTDSILLLSFDGTLLLTGSHGEDATALGTAAGIDGIARGSSTAVIERYEGRAVVDLSDASEHPLVEPAEIGMASTVTPLPDGSTLRTSAVLDDSGLPTGRTRVDVVSDDGAVRELTEIADTDATIQTCVSPSSRYVAILIAPDAISNPYDTYLIPLPERVQTDVLALADGARVVSLTGSSISWCQTPPV